jgi:AraC-like DNA-binding protein
MDVRHVKLSKRRDFFGFHAPRESLGGLIGPAPHGHPPAASVILYLQRRNREVRTLRVDGAATRVIPFPHAHRALMRSLADPGPTGPYESLEMLLPRQTFDQLADRQGASRIKRLDLEAGIAADDTVMYHLAACLDLALAAEPAMAATVDQITASVTIHIAHRYGGLQPERSSQHGGLAAWQLRRARASFDRQLDGSVSLYDLARECGLSVSHFSRAFRRSTGLAPHRWLVQRRVEVAKDLMLAEPMPLAQVAVACGFADQSHFTRTFASLTGLTPARWRTNQEREFALG